MILFRHCDARYPFLWESAAQPPARWHDTGEGPVHYLADTPNGAWAEFLRHEEITDPADLDGVARALFAVEVAAVPRSAPHLDEASLTGGFETYPVCRREAARLRRRGAIGLTALSAALQPGGATGTVVDGGVRAGPDRDGRVVALFGRRSDLVGWCVVADGRPPAELLGVVRHFPAS